MTASGGSEPPDIRPLSSQTDYEACVSLQREFWGDDVRETVRPALLRVSQKVGGITAGAFDHDGCLLRFVFGITSITYRFGLATDNAAGVPLLS